MCTLDRFFQPKNLWVIEFKNEESGLWEPSVWVALTRNRAREIKKDRDDFHRLLKAKTRIKEYKRISLM